MKIKKDLFKSRPPAKEREWHRWFAWYPVRYAGDYEQLVWWEYVEHKFGPTFYEGYHYRPLPKG